MAQVLTFPFNKKLPKEVEERLREITATYVDSMYEVLNEMRGDTTNEKEYDEMVNLMLNVVMEGLLDAVAKIGES